MLVCPFAAASWLPELMAFGPLDYVIGPADGRRTEPAPGSVLAAPGQQPMRAGAARACWRCVRACSRRWSTSTTSANWPRASARPCASWPGVVHAAMFQLAATGELALAAQHSPAGLDLARAAAGRRAAARIAAAPRLSRPAGRRHRRIRLPRRAGKSRPSRTGHRPARDGRRDGRSACRSCRAARARRSARSCLMFDRRHAVLAATNWRRWPTWRSWPASACAWPK